MKNLFRNKKRISCNKPCRESWKTISRMSTCKYKRMKMKTI